VSEHVWLWFKSRSGFAAPTLANPLGSLGPASGASLISSLPARRFIAERFAGNL